jgi:hypothetical protein
VEPLAMSETHPPGSNPIVEFRNLPIQLEQITPLLSRFDHTKCMNFPSSVSPTGNLGGGIRRLLIAL